MKTLKFFSKVALICNVCFVLFALFAMLETSAPEGNQPDIILRLPFIKDIIITLGFLAILINLVLFVWYLVIILTGKKANLPITMAIINSVFLIIQIFYFFIFT